MMDVNQLAKFIIEPALKDLMLYSEAAVKLMLLTIAVESDGATYIMQKKGPAIGIYQMEPATYNDIWQNYLKSNASKLLIMLSNFDAHGMPSEYRMAYDLRFATAMARLHYFRVKEPLPPANNIKAIAQYWKKYYNTHLGKGTVEKAIEKYNKFTAQFVH